MIDIEDLDFQKGDGLLPAIIQDAEDFQVLMLGYMNEEALRQTLKQERVTFYSRSKERLWTKGETSGNYLDLIDIQQDCDSDSLLVLAHPQGPTCHTGERTCFYRKEFKPKGGDANFLLQLEALIKSRKKELPDESYTSYLFQEGIDQIAQKVGEEAIETVIESKNDNRDDFIGETSDLLFHLLVLLAHKDIPLSEVVNRLKERHQQEAG